MENNQTRPNVGVGLGIAGLVLGIIALPLAILKCTFLGGLVLGILGVSLSAVGYTQAKKVGANTSLLLAALVISIISASFGALRLSQTYLKSKEIIETKIIPWQKLGNKLENLEENSDEFEEIFEEEFEKEFGGKMEDLLKELENGIDDIEDEFDKKSEEIERRFDTISKEEAARKLGRAAGKAVRGFVDELADSTDTD